MNKNFLSSVPLPCDPLSAEPIGTFPWKRANEVNRSILMNVTLRCDRQSGDRIAAFASK